MSTTSTRLLAGFGAGALSHVIFQGGLGAVYYAADIIPALPWRIAYALLEPRLTARLGRVPGGLAIGVAAMLARWFVVLPLKGAPVAEGLVPQAVGIYAGFHLAFGIGLALIYGAALGVFRRGAGASAGAVRG